MIPVTALRDRTCALFGLGGSGLATTRALVAGGAAVSAWDDNPDAVQKAALAGIATADLGAADWSAFDALVLAPGVPLTHPQPHWTVNRARDHHIPVIGDIELFCRERDRRAPGSPLIAITGTNGKSTTTALIAHILAHAGRDVQMGGNIGVPVLDLEPPAPDRIHVLECSSYQIDLAPHINPAIAILLNISPDHLDRHGTMAHYATVKARLLERAQTAIAGIDDRWCASIAASLAQGGSQVITVSTRTDRPMIDLQAAPALRGDHNLQNALAALHACRAVGLADAEIVAGMDSFAGLAHRMQIIARNGAVLFVNDSKATNADAAARSLASFQSIHWIAGGLAKKGGIEPLVPLFDRLAKAYLIGQAAPVFAATLGAAGIPYEISATLDVAVRRAACDAAQSDAAEPVVLLAPAAASFDQFANFERRGEAFVAAVDAMQAQPMPPAKPGAP